MATMTAAIDRWKLMKTNDKSIKHRQHLFSLQGWQFSACLCFELRWQITTPTDGQIEKFLSRCWITSTTTRMWVWGKRKKNKHQLMANNINQQPPGCDCEEEPVMQCYTGNCTNYHDCRSVYITIAISVGCQHHRIVKDSLKVVNLFLRMYWNKI